jgi:orotidine-5'-phosphate decarboxylase
MPLTLDARLRGWLAARRPPVALILEPGATALARCGHPDTPAGALALTERILEAAHGLVPLVKIQPAAFERFGPDGWAACREAIALLRSAGIGVLLDFKRADHAPVLATLISTYTGPSSPYGADGITLLPYLGLAEIDAAVAGLAAHGGLALVIAMTSNPGASVIQQADADGMPVAEAVIRSLPDSPGIGCVLGGPAQTAGRLLTLTDRIAVLPGWGRPAVSREALLGKRGNAVDRVLFSIGSRLLADPDRMREYLIEQADFMTRSVPACRQERAGI